MEGPISTYFASIEPVAPDVFWTACCIRRGISNIPTTF